MMSIEYVSPSALKHYDEKIKEYVNEQVVTDGNGYDDSALVERIENVESALDNKADTSDIPDVSNFIEKEEGKGLFSGSYNDLTDKPTIPSVDGLVSEDALSATLEGYVKSDELPNEYDDTALSNRVKTIEDDYLTSEDKTELTTAIATAKSEAIETVLGENVDADFDTLKEVADWIQSDTTSSAELITRVTTAESDIDALETSVSNKVDKVSGKGLSTNDLTSTLKSNYDTAYTHSQSIHAPSTAEKNVIVGVQKNGTDLTVDSSTRKVNITVPTKTSELTNDSGFKTTDNNTTYSLSKSGSTITLTGSDGSITSVTDNNTTYNVVTASANGLVPMFDAADGTIGSSSTDWVLTNKNGTLGWYKLPSNAFYNTTYSTFTKATSSTAGSTGLVPAPAAGKQYSYLRGDGTWVIPTNAKTLSDSATYTNSSGGTEDGSFNLAGVTSYRANSYGGNSYSLKLQVWRRPQLDNPPYSHTNGDFILFIDKLLPSLNNTSDLGSSSYKWKNVYCSTGAFNGSDRKIKKDINYVLDDRYSKLFDDLKICSYKYKAGTSDRTHIGVVAQDMLETMNEIGMDTKEFAGIGLDTLSNSETQTERYYYDLYCGFNNTFYNETDGSLNTDRCQKRETLTYDVHYRDSISIFDREQRFLVIKTNAEPTDYEGTEEAFPDIIIHSIKLTSNDESVEDYEINLHNHIAYDPDFHEVSFEYTEDGSLRIIPKERYDGVGIALREDRELVDLSMYDNIVIDVTYSDEFIIGANYHEYDIYHEMSEEERTIYMVRWGEIAALNVMKTQEHTQKIQSLEEELRLLKEELRLLKSQKS